MKLEHRFRVTTTGSGSGWVVVNNAHYAGQYVFGPEHGNRTDAVIEAQTRNILLEKATQDKPLLPGDEPE